MKFLLSSLAIGASVASAAFPPITFDVLRGESYHSAVKGDYPPLMRASSSGTSRSAAGVPLAIEDLGVFYAVNITLDGQQLEVLLDTGSSDLWVISSDAQYCQVKSPDSSEKMRKRDSGALYHCDSEISVTQVQDFEEYGLYNTKDFHDSGKFFYIQYGDYTFAEGTWGTAGLSIGDANVNDFTIGVAKVTNSTPTVFGIGFKGNEASDAYFMRDHGGAFTYDNFPIALKNAGYIDKLLYSLYMNADNTEGTVLFGGTDDSAYTGNLVTLPMDNIYADYGIDKPVTFNVILQGLSFTDDSGEESYDILGGETSVLLDSGTSACLIPPQAAGYVINALGASFNEQAGLYVTDCSKGRSDVTLNYKFDGITINVPISDMLVSLDNQGTQCAILIGGSGDISILGDPFLRGTYVVYDLENYEISLAPVKRG
ncbi:Aspartic proteinase 3 [Cyberlindnera fabianii]|uniref:Aspartic proteinase 3 n=1 Tax=Cyberlindnera fabianii TaxID=36022 RepID=A0A1V2L1E2_CYBFA|nr:Aspartic proteinase 3 [Cyberlindnera fabianii]